jgi:electron transfer flavoprotein alpha subunit
VLAILALVGDLHYLRPTVAAVLVHIDLDGDKPHPSSLVALAAGRQVASSWGATLYAALILQDEDGGSASDSVVRSGKAATMASLEQTLSRGGADKLVVAMTDVTVAPLWALVGTAWQGVIDHLRPRLVLFGADSPSASELAPRTGARIGARLLNRARTVGGDEIELRDRDGGQVRIGDSGAAVALVGRAEKMPVPSTYDNDIDVVVLALPGGADPNVELVGSEPAPLAHTAGTLVAIADDVATNPKADATRLATLLGAPLIGGAGQTVERSTPLAPELCIVIGNAPVDLAGCVSVVKIGASNDKTIDGALPAPADVSLASLVKHLEDV